MLSVQRFLEAMCEYFHSELKSVDFICAAEASRAEINTWVEQLTDSTTLHLNLMKKGINLSTLF